MTKIAILDDYQHAALQMADWSPLDGRAEITVFHDHLFDETGLAERLKPFDVLCVMRERTPMTRSLIERLPNLKLIASTAPMNASIDMQAAQERGITVAHTRYTSSPTVELTWALILSMVRSIPGEAGSVRRGGWQTSVGEDLSERTLGILGLGRIGSRVAEIARAFGMHAIAWSQNLDEERAAAAGATLVTKEELFRRSDLLTVHLVLSPRTRGLIGSEELRLMKPSARLINTSRGPIVDEAALIEALRERRIAGAALDVYDVEPLPADHPFRTLDNVLCTPHIGYVTHRTYDFFFTDTVTNIVAWLDGQAS